MGVLLGHFCRASNLTRTAGLSALISRSIYTSQALFITQNGLVALRAQKQRDTDWETLAFSLRRIILYLRTQLEVSLKRLFSELEPQVSKLSKLVSLFPISEEEQGHHFTLEETHPANLL